MRISDLLMNKSYLNGIAANKSRMDILSKQIANQSSILKPSDSPIGTARVLRLEDKLSSTDIFMRNIQNSYGFVNETIRGMETIESEITNILVKLTEANNPINGENRSNYADQLDHALNSILTAANMSYDGKYLFGGTSFSSQPFVLSADRSAVLQNVNDISGKSHVKVGNNTNQKINVTGSELFGTILKQQGSFDSSDGIGSLTNSSQAVYDAYGNQFNVNLEYEKISNTEYKLTYSILDSDSNPVKSDSLNLAFDEYTGNLIGINGTENSEFSISSSAHRLNFVINFNSLAISSSPSPLSITANQELDVFNTIIKIRDDLKNGLNVDDNDINTIKSFHQRLLNRMSDAGYTYNTLENTNSLLEAQKIEIESMISAEKDIDVAKAIIDLQNYDYLLQVSYKMSSMILPKSLLDYL